MRKNFPGHNSSEEIRGTNKADVIHGLGGNDKLIGRGGDDRVYGDDGNDKLFGGTGHDRLEGGSGHDRFRFKEFGEAHSDNIVDFKHGTDRVELDVFVFDQLALGAVSSDNFVQGTAAQDADDFLIFNAETGQLFFDADGNGEGEQVLLATIHLRGEEKILTAEDIFVWQPQSGD